MSQALNVLVSTASRRSRLSVGPRPGWHAGTSDARRCAGGLGARVAFRPFRVEAAGDGAVRLRAVVKLRPAGAALWRERIFLEDARLGALAPLQRAVLQAGGDVAAQVRPVVAPHRSVGVGGAFALGRGVERGGRAAAHLRARRVERHQHQAHRRGRHHSVVQQRSAGCAPVDAPRGGAPRRRPPVVRQQLITRPGLRAPRHRQRLRRGLHEARRGELRVAGLPKQGRHDSQERRHAHRSRTRPNQTVCTVTARGA